MTPAPEAQTAFIDAMSSIGPAGVALLVLFAVILVFASLFMVMLIRGIGAVGRYMTARDERDAAKDKLIEELIAAVREGIMTGNTNTQLMCGRIDMLITAAMKEPRR